MYGDQTWNQHLIGSRRIADCAVWIQLPKLCAFEHTYPGKPEAKPHSLLFIAGMSDGLCTVPYVDDLVSALEPGGWSVFSVLLSSSYSGWGVSSLDRDVEEIAKCVDYVKSYKAGESRDRTKSTGMIVLMGHSTGSQDVLHYLHSSNPLPSHPGFERPPVDGAVLQAPVSDRQALLESINAGNENDSSETLKELYTDLVKIAKTSADFNKAEFLLPLSRTKRVGGWEDVPLSSKRFLSVASPDSPESPMEDDLFSSDLHDDRLRQTFGMVGPRGLLRKSLLVIPGGADEFAPTWMDKEQLLQRWEAATRQGAGENDQIWDINSGIIVGAKHSPQGESEAEPRRELVSRVSTFLQGLEQN